MLELSFAGARRVICKAGVCAEFGKVANDLAITRALVVTDSFLHQSGLMGDMLDALEAAKIPFHIYDGVKADPPVSNVEEALTLATGHGCDGVIGFGGGSPMDVAKLVALLLKSPQSLDDIYGVDLAKGARAPLVLVPTTAGTGSETTPISILTKPDHSKAGVVSPVLLPDVALLDAKLTLGLPPKVTAATGIDAMVHAMEAYTTKRLKNPMSDGLAVKALELMGRSLRKAVHHGDDLAAREDMLLGSHIAGLAFANAPCAGIHALAYPLGGLFGVPHGLSNSLVMPHVMRFNAPVTAHLYAEIAPVIFPEISRSSDQATTAQLIEELDDLVLDLGLERSLEEVGVKESDIDKMAADAMQQQRLLINNMREITEKDARNIYRAALKAA